MNNSPLFSILIANYNNSEFICDAIDSVINQIYTNWEIVFVDDASDDGSVQVIQKLINQGVMIRLHVNNVNRGCGYSKRKCTELADGEICGFLDADDALREDAIQKHVNRHKKNPGCSLVYSLNYNCDENMNVLHKTRWGGEIPNNESQLTSKSGNKITHFASFKRSFYEKNNGINPTYKRAVDQDLYYKLEEVGQVCFIDEILYYYRTHPCNISMNDNNLKAKYWHYIANKRAYKRRKKVYINIANITYGQLQRDYLHIAIAKLELKAARKEWNSIFYYYAKMLLRAPFDKEFLILKFHYRMVKMVAKELFKN